MRFPYRHMMAGAIKQIMNAAPANTALPHAIPTASYKPGANRGKLKPAIVLMKAAAPVALAAYVS